MFEWLLSKKKSRFFALLLAILLMIAATMSTVAQEAAPIERTPWQTHGGYGVIPLHAQVPSHGDAALYEYKQVPPADDPAWEAPPLDGDGNISFSQASELPNGSCYLRADFTYFQTLVEIPADTTITEFEVRFERVDDGARAYVYNSQYPDGVYQPGTDIVLGGEPKSANLAEFIVAGETNRVVIVQVDDCPRENNLRNAQLYVNGTVAAENPAIAPRTADPLDLCLANVPEAGNYTLAYRLDIPVDSDYNANPVPYAVDNSARIGDYSRVAYCMELDNEWVWVSVDDFTGGNIAQTGVPVANVISDGFQQTVDGMNIFSNVSGVVTGENLSTGHMEFWHNCYTQAASQGLSQAGNVFDFDDTKSAGSPSCYGSMQIHNVDAQQTLFAFNAWDEAPAGLNEVGIGNAPTGNPDWTFARNADQYEERYLGVFVLESAGPSVRSCTQEEFRTAVQAGEASGTITLDGACHYELTSAGNDWNGGSGAFLFNTTLIEGNGAIVERAEDAPSFRILGLQVDAGMVIRNLTIRNGSSTADGGGIFANSALTLENVVLDGNRGSQGGGIYAVGNLTLNNVTLDGNSATRGGAISNPNGALTINGSTFLNNHASDLGGAFFKNGGTLDVTNTLFAQNQADSNNGAAVFIGGDVSGSSRIANNTITDNDGNLGSAITTWGALELTNTIIANHEIGLTAGGNYTVSENSNLFANTVLDVRELKPIDRWEGSKVVPDARFVDSAALDYRLRQDSPAVDSGLDLVLSSLTALSADADGNARPFTGTPADMGAYEFQGAGGPSLSILKQGPLWVTAGVETDFFLTVANNGVAGASDVQVVDVLPAGATYVAGSVTNGGTFADGRLTWNLGDLAPGDSFFLRYRVTASQDLVSNQYSVQSLANPDINVQGPEITSPVKTSIVAAMDFFPNPDGFSFANWGEPSLQTDLTVEDVVRIFGEEAACKSTNPCVLTAQAEAWRQTWIVNISRGHCAGMSMGSLNIFMDSGFGASDLQSEANVTFDLAQENARRYVAFYAAIQGLTPTNQSQLEQAGYKWSPARTPVEVLDTLIDNLKDPNATDRYRLSFHKHPNDGGGSGHTVVPFAVEKLNETEYLIYIYENNAPNKADLAIKVSRTITQEWSYVGTTRPDKPLYQYYGDATSGNLSLTSWRFHTSLPKQAYGSDGFKAYSSEFDQKLALVGSLQDMQAAQIGDIIEFQLDGEGYLLVTRSDGQRAGFDLATGQWIAEIEGAQSADVLTGLGYNTPPAIRIPHQAGMTYSLQVASRETRFGNSEDVANVNIFGTGFAMKVTDLKLIAPGGQTGTETDAALAVPDAGAGPSDLTTLGLDPDNKQITFGTETDATKNPTLSLSVSYLSGSDYSAAVKSVEVAGGHTVALSFDETTNTISVEDNAAGQTDYNLDVSRINADGTVDQYSDTVTDGGAAGVQVSVGQDDWNGQDPPAVQTQEAPTLPPPAPPVNFNPLFILHTATAQNTNATGTAINHPYANFNPNANIIVTKRSVASTAEVGVQYESATGRWLIVNQDGSAITAGDTFNIAIMSPASNNFVHTSTAESVANNWTVLDHPSLNNNPNAQVLVTPRTEPGSGDAVYHNHTIGVWYLNNTGRWAILNLDQSAFTAGVSFNVVVLSRHPGTALHRVTETNTSGAQTTIDHPSTNNNPEAMVYALPNFNPNGQGGVYNNHPIRVSYDAAAGRWQIVNQDQQPFNNDAAFNLAILGAPTYVEPVTTPEPTPTPVPPTPTPEPTPEPTSETVEESAQLLLTLDIHQGPINSVAVDDAVEGVLTASEDGTIRLVQNEDGSGITLESAAPVHSIDLSPDSRYVAAGLDNGQTEIWDWEAEALVTVLAENDFSIRAVAWSNNEDEPLLAAGGDEGVIRVWDALGEDLLFELAGHEGPVNAISWIPAFLNNGVGYLASASDDGTVRLWNIEAQESILILDDHDGPVNDVLLGELILSAGADGTVRIWQLAGESIESVTAELVTTLSHESALTSLSVDQSAGTLATGSLDGTIALWDFSSSELPTEPQLILRGHVGSVNDLVSVEGGIYSVGDDGTLRVWDSSTTEASGTSGAAGPCDLADIPAATQLAATVRFVNQTDVERYLVNDSLGWPEIQDSVVTILPGATVDQESAADIVWGIYEIGRPWEADDASVYRSVSYTATGDEKQCIVIDR